MKPIQQKQQATFIISAFLWLAIDLLTKWLAVKQSWNAQIIEDLFYFTVQKNEGVAFGLEFGFAPQIIASILVLAILIPFGWKHLLGENTFLNPFLFGIIVGGAIGNLLNRIFLGHVIDFIALKPIPIFNIADIGITVGLILLFLMSLRSPESSS